MLDDNGERMCHDRCMTHDLTTNSVIALSDEQLFLRAFDAIGVADHDVADELYFLVDEVFERFAPALNRD